MMWPSMAPSSGAAITATLPARRGSARAPTACAHAMCPRRGLRRVRQWMLSARPARPSGKLRIDRSQSASGVAAVVSAMRLACLASMRSQSVAPAARKPSISPSDASAYAEAQRAPCSASSSANAARCAASRRAGTIGAVAVAGSARLRSMLCRSTRRGTRSRAARCVRRAASASTSVSRCSEAMRASIEASGARWASLARSISRATACSRAYKWRADCAADAGGDAASERDHVADATKLPSVAESNTPMTARMDRSP